MSQAVLRNVRHFCTIQRTWGTSGAVRGKKMQFVIDNGSSSKGQNVHVDETINSLYPVVQVTGRRAHTKSYTAKVGKGDKYWQEDADKFYAMLMAGTPAEPLRFEGIPGEVSGFLGVVSEVVVQVPKKYGITYFSFTVTVVAYDVEPKLEYKKMFFDRAADLIQEQIDKVDAALALCEVVFYFINSVQNFFKKIEKLITSGTKFIELASNIIAAIKNPFGTSGLTRTLLRPLQAYRSAVNKIIAQIDTKFLANNPSGYYSLNFPAIKAGTPSSREFTEQQTAVLRGISNVSALSFIEASVGKITREYASIEDIMAVRHEVFNLLQILIDWNNYYGDDMQTANKLSALMSTVNGLFSQLYRDTNPSNRITVESDILPVVFYFNTKGSREGYDNFIKDNNLQDVIFIPKGKEVYLR